jgi:hypothetical protein
MEQVNKATPEVPMNIDAVLAAFALIGFIVMAVRRA